MRLLMILLSALLTLPGVAAADDRPLVSILKFGTVPATGAIEDGLLNVLHSHGLLSDADREALTTREDHEGESISMSWRDADFDLASANLLVDAALDEAPTVLVTLSTTMTQLAVNVTADMDEPPPIIFTSVINPYLAGIADAPCIKPAHVTGTESNPAYERVVAMLPAFGPRTRTIGIIFNPSDVGGAIGVELLTAHATELGYAVEQEAIVALSDMGPAAESLISRGIDIFVLPLDDLTLKALPVLAGIADDNSLPLVYPSPEGAYFGATIGVGTSPYYGRGVNAGHALAAVLKGEADVEDIAIDRIDGFGMAINIDAAKRQEVTLLELLLDQAGLVIENGEVTISEFDLRFLPPAMQMEIDSAVDAIKEDGTYEVSEALQEYVDSIEAPPYAEMTAEHIAARACTPELIAEQQAALDAAER